MPDYSAPAAPVVVRTVPGDLAGQRLDQALARMFPEHSRSRLQLWLRQGHIRLDARAAKPKQKVWGGEEVRLTPQPSAADTAHRPERLELEVVYEDESLLVIDKPAGLVVHPGSGNWQGTMLNALLHRCPQAAGLPRAGIVHRLDKDTSGLLVVAKTPEAQTALVRQLQARTVRREYLALVHGRLEADGEIDAPIGRDRKVRTRMAVAGHGKPSLTRYRVLRRFAEASLVECALSTGRTHQIRVHLHSLGHPVVGDRVYRGSRATPQGSPLARISRQALHAWRLSFAHPSRGGDLGFESAMPADMRELIAMLR